MTPGTGFHMCFNAQRLLAAAGGAMFEIIQLGGRNQTSEETK